MFQQTGYLNSMAKIQVITVLMPLICTVLSNEADNVHYAYLTFFMMLSSDFIDLLSPKFKDDEEIDLLYKKVVETVIIHEGLYPIQESMITWHQLTDLPLHIKNFGPLKGFWECNGERSLAVLKKEVPDGGNSYDKTVMRSYSASEEVKLQNCFNFKLDDFLYKQKHNEDDVNDINNFSVKFNQLQYSDEKFLLSDLISSTKSDFSDIKFNQYEIELLLDLFIIEIKKQTRNKFEAYYNSPIYRMFIAYKFHRSKNSFFMFLNDCIDTNSDIYKKYCIPKKESYYFFQCEMGIFNDIDEFNYFREDLDTVKKILFNFFPKRYKNALVFGIKMDSRGMSCVERNISMDNAPTNPLNKLKQNWFCSKDGLSSWFKYRYDKNSNINDEKFGISEYKNFCYGQFNYFFRAYLPDEIILHGIPLASAVCRFSELDKYMNTVIISTLEESFVLNQPFVVLTNVFSTKILVGGRDNVKLPFKLKKNYNQINCGTMNRRFSINSPTDANDLYFLDLDPHRRTVKFDVLNRNYNKFEYKKQYYK
jgi:hypothetical protein